MQELTIVTSCDRHYQLEDERVPGRRIHWMVDGKPLCVDLCSECELSHTINDMDNLVREYGHPDSEPVFTGKRQRRKRAPEPEVAASATEIPKTSRPSKARKVPGGDYTVNGQGEYQCLVDGCPVGTSFEKLQGLLMHQLRAHQIRAVDRD